MNINVFKVNSINEYRSFDEPTLFLTSDKIVADFLRQRGEAVCIILEIEDSLDGFSSYKYFITDTVQYTGHLEKVYCHIKNIPYVIAECEEFLIREEVLEDFDEIYAMYEDSECRKFLEALPDKEKVDKSERFESVKNGYMLFEYGMWIIEKKDSGKVIGRVGFEYVDDSSVSLGFVIKKDERGKGYAEKASGLCIGYLREVLPDVKITAKCHAGNNASIALLTKLGIPFSYVG